MITKAETKKEEAEIHHLLDAWTQAVNHKDIDALMAFYASHIVSFDVIPPLRYVGAQAYRENWEMGFDMCQDSGEFEMQDLQIAAGTDVAFCYRINRMHGTTKDGETFDCAVRWTTCFEKIDGQWLITHEHISVPVDMETGKGLMDLKVSDP